MNILVLEDDDHLACATAALIARMGHGVAIAHDCESARQLASGRQFDVILADVQLPDGDGRQVCDGLRMDGASQDAYMIAVTGRADLGATDFPSFDGYVRKPITFELLESVLEEWRVAAGLDRQPPANQPAQAGSPEVAATNAHAG